MHPRHDVPIGLAHVPRRHYWFGRSVPRPTSALIVLTWLLLLVGGVGVVVGLGIGGETGLLTACLAGSLSGAALIALPIFIWVGGLSADAMHATGAQPLAVWTYSAEDRARFAHTEGIERQWDNWYGIVAALIMAGLGMLVAVLVGRADVAPLVAPAVGFPTWLLLRLVGLQDRTNAYPRRAGGATVVLTSAGIAQPGQPSFHTFIGGARCTFQPAPEAGAAVLNFVVPQGELSTTVRLGVPLGAEEQAYEIARSFG